MVTIRGRETYPFYFGATPYILKLAHDLRLSMTPAEKLMWQKLRKKQLCGLKFRRQHPVNKFIADFFCYDAMLVIELDGAVHLKKHQKERDEQRTAILNSFGIKVIRFSNDEIENDIESCLQVIENEIGQRTKLCK